ncbi:MAG: hypothetical protein JW716_03085 [Candidatus Aenigmarchaeota archaeon]|nr:hypothetical protein [Candidatus Aenigmarchaeota archaeon]
MKKDFMIGYISGVICSKGFVIYNKKESIYTIAFETGNEELYNIFTEMWGSLMKTGFKTYEKIYKKQKRFVFRVYDEKTVRRFFYRYGFRTGSHHWKIPKIVSGNKESLRGFLSGLFDSGSYIRWKIRERGKKKEKVRNIRIVSPCKRGLLAVKNALTEFGISPMSYSSGKNYCLDIEGKMKLELFEMRIGFLLGINKIRLQEALSYKK